MLDLLKRAPAAEALSTLAASSEEPAATVITEVSLGRILDNPYQPRAFYDAEHILGLALSIKRHKSQLAATRGLQQLPLARVGVAGNHGEFVAAAAQMYANGQAARTIATKRSAAVQLLFGHSRLRAFMVLELGVKRAGSRGPFGRGLDLASVAELETRYAELLEPDPDYATMPLMLAFALDRQMWAHAITENSQRKNITAIDEARSLQRAIDEFGLTADEAAQPFGYARSTVANKLRLLALPADVQGLIERGELTERHGRELVRLADDPDLVSATAKEAVTAGHTVRQLADNVQWKEKQLRHDQEKARQLAAVGAALAAQPWALPGQTATIGADRISDAAHYDLAVFYSTDERDRQLIECGHCGPGCACFVIGYQQSAQPGAYQPAPDVAPDCVAACADRDKYWIARSKIEKTSTESAQQQQEKRERLAQAELLNSESHRLWQRWLAGVEKSDLWGDLRFWREVSRYPNALFTVFRDAKAIPDALDELLRLLYRQSRRYDQELKTEIHPPDDVVAMIKRLGGSVSRETATGGANE